MLACSPEEALGGSATPAEDRGERRLLPPPELKGPAVAGEELDRLRGCEQRAAAAKNQSVAPLASSFLSIFFPPLDRTSITMAKYSTIAVHISATLLLFLAPFLLLFPIGGGDLAGTAPEKTQPDGAGRYLPAVGPIDYRLAGDGRGRVLAPFQLCLLCRCCAAGDPANCTSMSCCFGINCALPDKPYGVCAFVPKTCDCTSCA